MTDIEMSYLNPAPCIDAALAIISSTLGSLGYGAPADGALLDREKSSLEGACYCLSKRIGTLSALAGGDEAWLVTAVPQINELIGSIGEIAGWLPPLAQLIGRQASKVVAMRTSLEGLLASLNQTRTLVVEALPVDPLWAHMIDAETADTAMNEFYLLVSILRSGTRTEAIRLTACSDSMNTEIGALRL